MKSNVNKEETNAKKKYVFFSDPDVIVKRAESTAAASQALQNFQIHERQWRAESKVSQSEPESSVDPQTKSDLKGLEHLLSYHPVQPYPFTFITAVKRKLALSMHAEGCKRAYEPEKVEKNQTDADVNKYSSDIKRSMSQAGQKMDFIKPLKVPDLKISPKTLDYSIQPTGSLACKKFDAHILDESAPLMSNKSPKCSEKLHRKLDFSLLEGSSMKNGENIEPLKAPDLSIGSSLSKKKEHARDSSREKENRSKRIKKDDSSFTKKDDALKETPRRFKSSKHLSRRDINEESDSILEMLKPESFLTSVPRESDFALKKPKTKNFLTSTVKKSDDKRHRYISTQSVRSARERSTESKNRNCDNDSNLERNVKIHERITTRDNFRSKANENVEHSHKILNQDFNALRQCDDHKYKNTELLNWKQHKHFTRSTPQGQAKQIENNSKVQIRQPHEKQKLSSTGEVETKDSNTASDISEEIKTASCSIASLKVSGNLCRIDVINKTDNSLKNERSLQQSKTEEVSHEVDQSGRNSQTSSQMERFRENLGDVSRSENSLSQANNTDSKLVENSTTQVDTNTSSSQSKSSSEYKNSSKSLSGLILDPTRISFRDESFGEQNEFCDLVTPAINLVPRSKRRKNFPQEQSNETDLRSPKHKPANNVQCKEDGIQLLHPTALHMQFQAELQLFDSFNESLRQVMDVENCLCSAKHEQEQELLLKQKENEIRRKNLMLMQAGQDTVDTERHQGNQNKSVQETIKKIDTPLSQIDEETSTNLEIKNTGNENPNTEPLKVAEIVEQPQDGGGESDNALRKSYHGSVKVTEVQTQTANDIATQTETPRTRRRHNFLGRQIPGITYERGSSDVEEIPQLSLESFNQLDDFDQIENVSLPSKVHTMSEISLHETTSSIRTETGTEISISTRDVTCSFNKYLDSELAQLIKDEKQRYDEIEMLFKSREKTLNDRTKKLVKLEEQKRALRDMGQDSRISSVKKKQRALLLKLQQEKDEMNRLKELHKKASQERKLMLQKQRNMLNPQMSTKNILTKLKRSADSQSPRRLSGPMKGYDIRSPSSMSSLVDSDKSQVDRSHVETKTQVPDVRLHKSDGRTPRSDVITSIQEGHGIKFLKADQFDNMTEQSDTSLIDSNVLSPDLQKCMVKQQKIQNLAQKFEAKSKYETRPCKYKEVMPKIDTLHHKLMGTDVESNTSSKKCIKQDALMSLEKLKLKEIQQKSIPEHLDKSVCENIRSESDTLVDEYSKKSKSSQATEINFEHLKPKKEKESLSQKNILDSENLNTESDSIPEELISKKSKSSQVMEDISELTSRSSKKTQSTSMISKENCKKAQTNSKTKSNSKRKGSRSLKSKTSSDILSENILRSKSSSQISEEIMKHHSKRSKLEKDNALSEDNYQTSLVDDLDANESQSSLHALVKHSRAVKEKNYQLLRNMADEHKAKENISRKELENLRNSSGRKDGNLHNVGNMSTRSQVSTLTISHHSSGESEKSYSRSVVIRAQDHHFRTTKKLEQILSAREATLASRRSCVEEWIAWHSRLCAEENRVARMEEAAFKLVSAASNALSYHDTTVSSDTSDVESRIEILAKKLAERRTEMARLKREAKRQAKQRLKALETNLLNQIKKYDTTIYEMREKLENKRGAILNDGGSSEKLAIESKSLTDFKIPEIPIKRIKEIYKNSDLLKSRSESELRSLICESNQCKDSENIYKSENSVYDDTSYRKSSRSIASHVTDRAEMSNSDKKVTSQVSQSIFEDIKSTTSKDLDFISENIESRSLSEQIDSNNYTSNVRLTLNKSEDEISTVSLRSKSDQDYDEIKHSRSNEIYSRKSSPSEVPEIDSENTTLNSQTKASQKSIISGGSKISLHEQSGSIPENIQRITSSQEAEIESIETIPEVKISRSIDTSDHRSISKSISSEYPSQLEQCNSESAIEHDPITQTISDNATTDNHISEKIARHIDEDVSKSEKHRSVSPRVLSPKTTDSEVPSEISKSHRTIEGTTKSISEKDAVQTPLDNRSATEGSSVVDEIDKSVQKSKSISSKLSFLELGKKNLNDDISTLENDLKVLSEMMSQFSKKSDSKLKSGIMSENENKIVNIIANDSDKGTSEDITDLSCRNDDVDQEIQTNVNNTTYIVDETHDNSELNDKDLTAQVTKIMLKIMPENETSSPPLSQEIDFKARSREILNEIEKSIISEHVKSPESTDINGKSMETKVSSLEKKNEELIDDLDSLEHDIMSIAEIISNASEAKKDIRMIRSLGHDSLFEDEFAIEDSPPSCAPISEEPKITPQYIERDSPEVPVLSLPNEFDEDENVPRSSNELEKPLQSINANLEEENSQDVTENSFEASTTNLEQPNMIFETFKDPEYEDISEESLEVSEIMDRSESQRSERQLYQKPSRLPEKYQMTQKSEDVLRILDEITQKSNEASQRSQQFSITPDNNARKIDELLHRSERLSHTFQALTKKPSQPDNEFNLPIDISRNSSGKSVSQAETSARHSEQNLNEKRIDQTIELPHDQEQQKLENVLRDFQTPITLDASNKVDPLTDIVTEKQSTNSITETIISPSEQNRNQTSNKEETTNLDEESEKSNVLQQTDIQRPNIIQIEESNTLIESPLDSYESDGKLQTNNEQHQQNNSEQQILDIKKSEIESRVFDDNLSRVTLQDPLTDKESVKQVLNESRDKILQNFVDLSEKSEKSIENSDQLTQKDETKISETGKINILTELSANEERDEASNENLIDSESSKAPKVDEVVLKSKTDGNSYKVDVSIHQSENVSTASTFEDNSLQKNVGQLDTLELEVKHEDELQITGDQPDVVAPGNLEELEELEVKLQPISYATDVIQSELEKVEDTQTSFELCGPLLDKPENSLHKTTVADKSDCTSQKSDESHASEKSEDILQKYEVELPSESSEEVDTPRSVSEIEMDSPRDPNDSRLDIEGLDDDLLGNDSNFGTQNVELRTEFHPTPVVATSEKDIEAMIDKLKVSLEQPGLDVAELEAKLLRIQQLQIELEIKKLEAEEVSYYVREIPNKPPPPYTPPSGGRLSTSQTSPSPAPAVVPTNVEDLTSFTEKATHLIYQAKTSGDDIINLEPPIEICELSKDNNDTTRRDRKIYNTFLFDLCKETISEVYQSEYEKPGPSWLKPNAKTKPTMKIPKTVQGLNDYVSKEVATLFGFKTKLQRENLVMRWSRKRRDRVDELLAREAQAEEDEWTKFHHDELAVKNELTTAILDSLILDAANVVKMAYIKKRKIMS